MLNNESRGLRQTFTNKESQRIKYYIIIFESNNLLRHKKS